MGKREDEKKKAEEIAKKMLQEKMEVALIMKFTGLTKEGIKKLEDKKEQKRRSNCF